MNEDVRIDSLSRKGHGLAQLASTRQVEVPCTLPGERVTVQLPFHKSRRVQKGRLQSVLLSSSERRLPRCSHFGSCGGCRWQHWDYVAQCTYKEEQIQRLFSVLDDSQTICYPLLPCKDPWRYRNKMEWTFSQDVEGQKFLGLMQEGSRGRVCHLHECHLVAPWFLQGLQAVFSWWSQVDLPAYRPSKNVGALRTCTMRHGVRTQDRLVMITIANDPSYPWNKSHTDSLVNTLQTSISPPEGGVLSIVLQIQQAKLGEPTQFVQSVLAGPGLIREKLFVQSSLQMPPQELVFSISPSAFFQPNTFQAEQIYSRGLQMADFSSQSVIYDLYCGTGTFACCASIKNTPGPFVLGIEQCAAAVADARENGKRNGLEQLTFWQGDVADRLTDILQDGAFPLPDGIILDPPRVGVDPKGMQQLTRLSPHKIVYVSCNPDTQLQNIQELQSKGYRVCARQAIDAFPHTPHVEHIVFLVKK